MNLLLNVLCFSIVCGVALGGGSLPIGPDIDPSPVPPSTIPPPTPTTTKPTTTTTTKPPPPSTTTPKPTPTPTTTPKPTPAPNPTPTPSTTTPKPTPSTSTTTTPKPASTTPKPTPAPTPVPPKAHKWWVNDTKNGTCVIATMATTLEVIYMDKNESKVWPINVPVNATASGSCEQADVQFIKLTWNETKFGNDSLTITFKMNPDSPGFMVHSIAADLVGLKLPGYNESVIYHVEQRKNEFETPFKHSYRCYKEQTLNLTNMETNATMVYMKVSDVQLQAFRNATGADFEQATSCIEDQTSDVVAIAVGVTLAVLIILVVVAFLIARRRSQSRGYLSM